MSRRRLIIIIVLVAVLIASFTIYLNRGPTGGAPQINKPTLFDAGGFVEPAQSGQKTVELTVTVTDGKFSPGTLAVPVGARVVLTLVNLGTEYHDWTAVGKYLQTATPTIAPNQRISISFVPSRAETITYYCSEKGHEASGERGTLVIQ